VATNGRATDGDRQVIAVLRVRVSSAGRLRYGEAIEAETEHMRRFTTWIGLVMQVRGLIAESQGILPTEKSTPPQTGLA
jgi:hypothetical protein